MDVHKLSISAGVLPAGVASPVVDKIGSDEESVRRLVGRRATDTPADRTPRSPKTP